MDFELPVRQRFREVSVFLQQALSIGKDRHLRWFDGLHELAPLIEDRDLAADVNRRLIRAVAEEHEHGVEVAAGLVGKVDQPRLSMTTWRSLADPEPPFVVVEFDEVLPTKTVFVAVPPQLVSASATMGTSKKRRASVPSRLLAVGLFTSRPS